MCQVVITTSMNNGDVPIKEIGVEVGVSGSPYNDKQAIRSKEHFKCTPINHAEAFNIHITQSLTNEINGDVVSFTECKNIGEVAFLLIGSKQWYKIENCRIVGIEEAYLVLERGGIIYNEHYDDHAIISPNNYVSWSDNCMVAINKETLNGWVVLAEGKQV